MAGSFQKRKYLLLESTLKLDVGKGKREEENRIASVNACRRRLFLSEAQRPPFRPGKDKHQQGELHPGDGKHGPEAQLQGEQATGTGTSKSTLGVKNMDSFKPENVAKNIPALSKMLAARNLLKDLKSEPASTIREFRKRLEDIIKDPGAMKSLQEELKKIVAEEPKEERMRPSFRHNRSPSK